MTPPVAIVLGAGIGGRAVAEALSGTWQIVVVDVDEERAAALADSVGGVSYSVDVLDREALTVFRDEVVERFGRIDAVVHLVGGWKGSVTVDPGALDAWQAVSPGVLGTVMTTTAYFREVLLQSPQGRYVMVSSTAAHKPTAGNVAYATAKAAAETWVAGLAHAFKDSSARAIVLAVMALVTDEMRAAEPDKTFRGYTDTRALADAVAVTLGPDGPANGAVWNLTEAQ